MSTTGAPVVAVACDPTTEIAEPIDVTAHWSVGDRVRLERTQSQTSSGVGTVRSTAPVEIEVLAQLDDGFELAWEAGKTDFSGALLTSVPAATREQLSEELAELSRVRVEYRTDIYGAFIDVTNAAELVDELGATLDFFERYVFSEMSAAGVAAARLLIDQISTEEVAAATYSEDIAVYHSAYGYLLEGDTPVVFESELPNLLGGEPFRATQTAVAADGNSGCASISILVEPEPDGFRETLSATIAVIAAAQGQPLEEVEAALNDFTIVSTIDTQWDPASTWAVSVVAQQRARVGTDSRIDTTIFEVAD